MAQIVPTVGWICVEHTLWEEAIAMLDASKENLSAQLPSHGVQSKRGTIGSSNVIVFRLSTGSVLTESAWVEVQSIVACHTEVQAFVITGCMVRQSLSSHSSLGDVFISPSFGGGNNAESQILQRAIDVLHGEAGDSGHWLPSSTQHSNSTGSAQDFSVVPQGSVGEEPSYPKLHYLQDFEAMETMVALGGQIPCFNNTNASATIVLGVCETAAPKTALPETNWSQNVASYTKELIQLMATPSIRKIPVLDSTEKVVPVREAPLLPSLPTHRFPKYGNAVLLVIPTENKGKVQVFKDYIAGSAPAGVEVHTITISVSSDVNEQPYNEAGVTGASNRIRNALNRLQTPEFADVFVEHKIGTVMAVAIESYIQTENIDQPADFGIAVIYNATTHQSHVDSSRGVTVPVEYIERAQRFGNDGDVNHGNITVGQVLAARVPGLDKADWHRVLAGCSRYTLLREAVRALPIPW